MINVLLINNLSSHNFLNNTYSYHYIHILKLPNHRKFQTTNRHMHLMLQPQREIYTSHDFVTGSLVPAKLHGHVLFCHVLLRSSAGMSNMELPILLYKESQVVKSNSVIFNIKEVRGEKQPSIIFPNSPQRSDHYPILFNTISLSPRFSYLVFYSHFCQVYIQLIMNSFIVVLILARRNSSAQKARFWFTKYKSAHDNLKRSIP